MAERQDGAPSTFTTDVITDVIAEHAETVRGEARYFVVAITDAGVIDATIRRNASEARSTTAATHGPPPGSTTRQRRLMAIRRGAQLHRDEQPRHPLPRRRARRLDGPAACRRRDGDRARRPHPRGRRRRLGAVLMAVCNFCGVEMTTAASCTLEVYDDFVDGLSRGRTRYGDGSTRASAWRTSSRPRGITAATTAAYFSAATTIRAATWSDALAAATRRCRASASPPTMWTRCSPRFASRPGAH